MSRDMGTRFKTRKNRQKMHGGVVDFGTLPAYINQNLITNENQYYYDTQTIYYKKIDNKANGNALAARNARMRAAANLQQRFRQLEIGANPNVEIGEKEYESLSPEEKKLWMLSESSGAAWGAPRMYRKRKNTDTLLGKYNELIRRKQYNFYVRKDEFDRLVSSGIQPSDFITVKAKDGMFEDIDWYRPKLVLDVMLERVENELSGLGSTNANLKRRYYLIEQKRDILIDLNKMTSSLNPMMLIPL